MANPTWFIKEDYLLSKLAQLKQLDPVAYGSWNIVTVDNALKDAGFDNAYDHFAAFGAIERTSPNKYFVANEYLAAKAVQLNTAEHGGRTDWTVDSVALAFSDAGVSPYEHFNTTGWAEGVNPSNAFDVAAYLEAKAAELNAEEVDGRTDWTAEDVQEAFVAAGLDPLAHYEIAGREEGIPVVPATNPVVPPGVGGETFTLTTGVDNWTGTAGDDVVQAQNATLNTFDYIDGGAGQDTMVFVATNDVSVPVGATVKNIETINVLNNGNHNINAAGFVGAQAVWQIGGAGNVAGLANGATAGFRDVVLDGGEQVVQQITDLTVGPNVKVDTVISLTINGQTFTTTNNSSTRPAIQDLAAQINAAGIGVSALDVSNAGEMRLESTNGEEFTVTGVRDGGPIEDPVTIQEAGTEIVDGRDYNVSFTGESGVIALDNVDFGESQIAVHGANLETVTVTGAVSEEGLGEDDFGSDLNLNLSNDSGTVETLNLAVTNNVDLAIDAEGAASLVTFDGSASTGGIRINLIDAPADALSLESATFGSGDDRVLLNNVASTADEVSFDFGAGNDEIVVGLQASGDTDLSIATGAGDDVIVLQGGNINVNDDADGFDGSVTISDFTAASDTLLIEGFDGFTAQNLVNNAIAGAESLYEAVSAIAGVIGTGGTNVTDFAQFVFEGNTYIYGDVGDEAGLAGDLLVGLTGVVTLDNTNVAEFIA